MQASSFTACAFATEVHRVGPSGPQNLNLSLHHRIPPHSRREGTESMSNRRHQGFNIHHSKSLFPDGCQTSIINSPLCRPGLAGVETGWANPSAWTADAPSHCVQPHYHNHLPSLPFVTLPTLLLWHAHMSQSPSDREHSGKPKLPGLLRRDGHTQSRDDSIHLPSGMTSVNCRRCRRLGAGSAWLAHPHTSGAVGCSRRFPNSLRGVDRAGTPRSDQVNKVNNYLSASLGFFSSAHSTPSRKESNIS